MIIQIPTADHLSRIYFELAKIGAKSAGAKHPWPYKPGSKEELIALASDMSRYDPRLFDILVLYFISHWREINPARLRSFYPRMKTPQVIAVIGEFMKETLADDEASYFIEYLTRGLRPAAVQLFFYDLYAPGGRLVERVMEEGLLEYKKWGFLSCERPVVNSSNKEAVGRMDNTSRLNVLKRLLKEKKVIQLKDYREAVKNSISRQQALIDLKESRLAKRMGKGRGARWRLIA